MSRLGTASDAGLYGRLFRRMRRLCSATERTPQALYVPDDIEIDRTSEVYQTKFSKVFKGRRGAEFVAVKVFDVHKDDKLRARKASDPRFPYVEDLELIVFCSRSTRKL